MFRALGRHSYRHRRAVIVLWLLVVLVGLPLIPGLPRLLKPGGFSDPNLESERARQIVEDSLGQRGAYLVAIFQIRPGEQWTSADDPRFFDAIEKQLAPVSALPSVQRILLPREVPRQISPDKSTALAIIALRGDGESAPQLVPEVRKAIGNQPIEVIVTGAPVAYADIIRVSEEDLRRAELISIPLALLALVVVFGSLVAAGMPVVVGGLSVLVALALLALVARVTDLSVFVLNLTTMLGLGLGTDYALFMTSRFREELKAGFDVPEAVERTVDHAGRAVFFSGLTVFVGLSGLTMFNFMMLRSLGIGGAIVVALGVLAALTLLPALLGIVGHRINRLTILRWNDAQSTFWTRLADSVMRRPWRVLIPVVALLLALGTPFLHARFSLPDAGVLPDNVESKRGYEVLQAKFGNGEVNSIVIAVQAPGSMLEKPRIDALFDLTRFIASDPGVARVESIVDIDSRISREQYHLIYRDNAEFADPYTRATLAQYGGDRVTTIRIAPNCTSIDESCTNLVHRLRALRPGADLSMLVGGGPPAVMDIVDRLYTVFPRAIAVVVISTYLILFYLFRSVVLPLKAIAMNALSLLASYGALVIVFQDGHGAWLIGSKPLGYVEATLPIIMFCLLFGLSMDYEVFLLSRIKEAWDRGETNSESVASGLASSGQVITSAALIVVLVSLSFVSAEIILVKAVGLGTALAVLLDATVVRALLVPATMRLMGRFNWWMPSGLVRLLPRPVPLDRRPRG